MRRYARGTGTDKVADSDILAFIQDASSQVEDYTQQIWDERDATDYINGSELDRLGLPHYPVTTITSISKRVSGAMEALAVYDPETDEGDYYLERPGSGVIRWTSSKKPGVGTLNIKAVYKYGYASTPEKIRKLTAMIAAISTLGLASGEVSPDGLVSISEGALSLSWGGGPYQETISRLIEETDKILGSIPRRLHFGSAENQ